MLSVVIASALGAVARYLFERWNTSTFPIFTLLVNVLGSFVAGFALALDISASNALIAFSGTFTTFSGLIAGTSSLARISRMQSLLYGHGSIALSVAAAWIGLSTG